MTAGAAELATLYRQQALHLKPSSGFHRDLIAA